MPGAKLSTVLLMWNPCLPQYQKLLFEVCNPSSQDDELCKRVTRQEDISSKDGTTQNLSHKYTHNVDVESKYHKATELSTRKLTYKSNHPYTA